MDSLSITKKEKRRCVSTKKKFPTERRNQFCCENISDFLSSSPFYLAQTDSSRDCETIKEGRSIDQQIYNYVRKFLNFFFSSSLFAHPKKLISIITQFSENWRIMRSKSIAHSGVYYGWGTKRWRELRRLIKWMKITKNLVENWNLLELFNSRL